MPKTKKSETTKAKKDIKEPKKTKTVKAPKEVTPKAAKKAPAKPEAPAKVEPKAAKAAAPGKVSLPEIVISLDDISLRAYFIAERRQSMGWPGDSDSDWVEAERQLKAEARRKASA